MSEDNAKKEALDALELMQKRCYSHAAISNDPKIMREWIDSDAAKIRAALQQAPDALWQPTHRHVRRGSLYQKIGNAQLQIDKPRQFSDYAYMIVYRGEDGFLWVRPVDEFIDGRFAELPTPQAAIKAAMGEE